MSNRLMDADSYVHVLEAETERAHAFKATDLEGARAWQRSFRPVLRELLGLDSIAERGAPPMNARKLSEETLADHVREEWRLETEPGFEVPFFFLRPASTSAGAAADAPAGAPRRLPLVITPHGHNKAGKNTYVGIYASEEERHSGEVGERNIALQAVREGYLAIAPDMRAFAGLRRSEEKKKDATSSCRTLQMQALLFGRTLIGERVWDVQRLIDWALARPDVDPERIVVTGNSGGGTVSLFAAAVDERIRVSVPGSYFSTFKDALALIHHCECNYIPGIMRHAEMWDVAGLIAPRPFLAVAGDEDRIFPLDAVQRSFARLREVYRTFGAEDRCRLSVNSGGHRYYKRDVWPFVKWALQLDH